MLVILEEKSLAAVGPFEETAAALVTFLRKRHGTAYASHAELAESLAGEASRLAATSSAERLTPLVRGAINGLMRKLQIPFEASVSLSLAFSREGASLVVAAGDSFPLLELSVALRAELESLADTQDDGLLAAFVSPESPAYAPRAAVGLAAVRVLERAALAEDFLSREFDEETASRLLEDSVKALASKVASVNGRRGRKKRSIEDAGAYVPGSAKERAALRQLTTTAEEFDLLKEIGSLGRIAGEGRAKEINSALIRNEEDEDGTSRSRHVWPSAGKFVSELAQATAETELPALRSRVRDLASTEIDTTVLGPAFRMLKEAIESALRATEEAATKAATRRDEIVAAFVAKSLSAKSDHSFYSEEVEAVVAEGLLDIIREALSGARDLLAGVAEECAEAKAALSDDDADGLSRGFAYQLTGCVSSIERFASVVATAVEAILSGKAPIETEADSLCHDWEMANLLAEARRRAEAMGRGELAREISTPKYVKEFLRRGGRTASDISTPEDIVDRFGIKRVEFGEYVSDKRREDLMQRTAASLRDFADALSISDKEVSLGGRLGIGLGSRGRGGKNAAKAHYEPDLNMINMTRDKGDGSLAHELGHAIDYGLRNGSMSDGSSEEIPADLLEAVAAVRKALLTSSKDEFIKRRREELATFEGERAKLQARYNEEVRKLNALYEERTKEAKAKRAEILSRLRGLPEGEGRDALRKELAILSDLIRTEDKAHERRGASIGFWKIRLDKLKDEIGGLSRDIRSAESDYPLTKKGWFSERVGKMPVSAIVDAMGGENLYPSRFVDDATVIAIETGRKDYWQSPVELFARAFEAYVAKLLRDKGQWNNYLVKETALVDSSDLAFFPQGPERARTEAALADFIAAARRAGVFGDGED